MQEVRIVHTHIHVHVHLLVGETAVLVHAYTHTPALTCASSATTGFSSFAALIFADACYAIVLIEKHVGIRVDYGNFRQLPRCQHEFRKCC